MTTNTWKKIHGCPNAYGQTWEIQVPEGSEGDGEFRIVNLKDGKPVFYSVYMKPELGGPLFDPEPVLAISVPETWNVQDLDGNRMDNLMISGIIPQDENSRQIKEIRLSLSRAVQDAIAVENTANGTFEIDGRTFYAHTLFMKDANRFNPVKCDLYVRETKPVDGIVKYLELGDMLLRD